MSPYADTNFYTRLYLPLAESEEAAGLLADAQAALSPPLPVTWLHRLETINAFQLHVFAGKSHGHTRITSEQAAAAHATFQSDLALHVASALLLKCDAFWSFDPKASRLASLEVLKVR